MFLDSSEMLRIFFAISHARIHEEIVAGERDLEGLLEEAFAAHQAARGSIDPLVIAESFHKQMVRAKVLQLRDEIPVEVRLMYAVMPTEHIAEQAAALAQEESHSGEPSSEDSELFDKAKATAFTTILRRYELGHIADMFENDRPQFNELREAGRKLIFDNSEME
ncbi:hypothetical protein [Anatilimnocola floriformis]|uniref:hypothetical protein n=1 Tax=Anatilimnocola floriformis TaxID=2948575 RepID=UPI0020C599B1|nr:hypothetical protein [Anatilimnocola floriformis]